MIFREVRLYVEFGQFMLQKYDFFCNYCELCGNYLLDESTFFRTRHDARDGKRSIRNNTYFYCKYMVL